MGITKKELKKLAYIEIIANLLLLISFIVFATIMRDFFYIIQILGFVFMICELVLYFIKQIKAANVFYVLKYITLIFSYLFYVLIMLLKGISYLFSFVSLVHLSLLIFVVVVLIIERILRKKYN